MLMLLLPPTPTAAAPSMVPVAIAATHSSSGGALQLDDFGPRRGIPNWMTSGYQFPSRLPGDSRAVWAPAPLVGMP
eukprot:CAMPEP_0179219578 /NCGR_PEP_ID=MMETSP0797-20121207/5112_1 /TAXON_ID=47934 /ORGANISM="Dinophysis acuminata, Strain DAEP01" /LENGTH=75 /DNA_ID=CAMNT_0020926063 /DNA_START=41 /DNA_END=265 /DNA_ORIENTATION=-